MNELTAKDLHWFCLANAHGGQDFYAFKDRFLKRFGTPDGYDLQKVEKMCFRCDGSGIYSRDELCRSCDGTGIHHTNEHWLRRYNLEGRIYHKPIDNGEVWHEHGFKYPEPRDIIEGLIRHDSVDSKVARRAFYRLLIRHEPITFYNIITDRILTGFNGYRTKLVWKLIRLRNRLDLFKAIPEDDVPF